MAANLQGQGPYLGAFTPTVPSARNALSLPSAKCCIPTLIASSNALFKGKLVYPPQKGVAGTEILSLQLPSKVPYTEGGGMKQNFFAGEGNIFSGN